MESLVLNLQSKSQITACMKGNFMMAYEIGIYQEMIAAIKAKNQ